MRPDPRPFGDGAVRWTRDPSRDARSLLDALRALPDVVDAVVTERHAMVTYDPARPVAEPWSVEAKLPAASEPRDAREHVIRARYDGPDLDDVAARASLDRDGVVRAHADRVYVVRFIGFLPGFAYLGEVDPRLAIARRAEPRARVDAGSVGVAAGYTAVYPFASPGGWHLIARALDFAPFDAEHGARLALGDRVRFAPTP
jgi:UPF0271 protein